MKQQDLLLKRLLSQQIAVQLLQEFVACVPDIKVTLLASDDEAFATVGLSPVSAVSPYVELPLVVNAERVGLVRVEGPGLEHLEIGGGLQFLQHILDILLQSGMESRALAQEILDRYREINLLYKMAETIEISLDTSKIAHLVLEEAVRLIQADVGGILVRNADEELELRASYGHAAALHFLEDLLLPLLPPLLDEGTPSILADHQLGQVGQGESILCVPMKVYERVVGVVVLGRLAGQSVFTAGDQKLLLALSAQAAAAIENARLFGDLKQQRDTIVEMKNEMDNIFSSIGSGVITMDVEDVVTVINPAAERILGISAETVLGKSYMEAFPELGQQIEMLIAIVKQRDEPIFGYEMHPSLPNRGYMNLRLHLNPLKDNQNRTKGIAIVVDDMTQQKQLEALVRLVRGTFERYVPPQVVEQLLSDPSQIRLGGARREVTILFADIRGFTAFSENLEPEPLVEILNQHLTLVANAILDEEGTLDKFMGDAVMAIFNAPLPQPNHTLRAVRAALKMQQAVTELRQRLSPDKILSFGIGIVTGPVVVGNVGSPALQNYTAIGDSVNLASRLQSYAGPGQILLDARAYECVRDCVKACELGPVNFKGHSEPDLVFEVLGLLT